MRYIIMIIVCIPLVGCMTAESSLTELLRKLDRNKSEKDTDSMNYEVAHGLVDLFKKVVDGCSKECKNKQGYGSQENAFNFCKLLKIADLCKTFQGADYMCAYTCGFCTCENNENTINARAFQNDQEKELARKLHDGFMKLVDEIY